MSEQNNFFADIHCHPTLRVYNRTSPNKLVNYWPNKSNKNINTKIGRWARMQTKDIAKESQTNFYAAAKGNVRVIFDSLYPVEEGFVKIRRVPGLLVGKKGGDDLMRTVTGVHKKRLQKSRKNRDYFVKLQEQYQCLLNSQGNSPCGKHNYKLVANYNALQNTLQQSESNIAIITTIEGGHVFGCGTNLTAKIPLAQHKKILSKNIATVKAWEFPPVFVNLSHHFWNQLCGQARSFKSPIHTILNQRKGMNKGITELGWHVIAELLSRKNGRRIIIDVKHMSAKGRKEYYQFVNCYNQIHPEDPIPVVCSHTGVSGFDTFEAATNERDKMKKMKNSPFNNWSLNMCDEDIKMIYRSGGLMGIMLDKGLLSSPQKLKEIQQIINPNKRKEAFVKAIWDTVFQAVKAVGHKGGWDIIALGSDYDGIINHIDYYADMSSMNQLAQDLIDYLQNYEYQQDLWFGYTPAELLQKIKNVNTMNFLKRHF